MAVDWVVLWVGFSPRAGSVEPFGVFLGSGERAGVGGWVWWSSSRGFVDQVTAGSALIRASARMKSCCQGQRAGRWRVHWRAVRVSRPGMLSSRRRRVRAARTVWRGRPIAVVQRVRLCAIAAITVQALLALNWPEGKCASAWS